MSSPRSTTLSSAVVILALAMFLLTAFQTFILVRARQNMEAVRVAQEQPVQEGTKVRQRIDALAGRVATLAEEGNANAKVIVENFRRQGVELKKPPK